MAGVDLWYVEPGFLASGVNKENWTEDDWHRFECLDFTSKPREATLAEIVACVVSSLSGDCSHRVMTYTDGWLYGYVECAVCQQYGWSI